MRFIVTDADGGQTREMVKVLEQGSAAINRQAAQAKLFTDQQMQDAEKIEQRWNKMWDAWTRAGKKAILELLNPENYAPVTQAVQEAASTLGANNRRRSSLGGTRRTASAPPAPQEEPLWDRPLGRLPALPNPAPSQNPADEIASIQRRQQLLALYGETATVAERVKQKEDELRLAYLQSNVSVLPERATLIKRIAEEQAIGITAIRASAEAQQVEAATIGMSAGAAAEYTAVQNRLNEARRRGETLSAANEVAIRREAAALCAAPSRVVIDEFTSVVDRQIARIGAFAFAKAWRRTGGQAVVLSCHYDILDWLQPDWVFDTASGRFSGRWLQPRPPINLTVHETDWSWWPLFEPHHYLKLPKMIAARCYVGFVDGAPVAHLAVSTRPGLKEARACRLVVMPEWQGAGVGMRFLNAVCAAWRRGRNLHRKPMPTLFHTSHPGLAAALRRDPLWAQVSASLYGNGKARSAASIRRSGKGVGTGYGGHFRAVQGFRYVE